MFRDILVCVDLADAKQSISTLATAVRLVQSKDVVLHVLTVVPDLGMTFVAPFFPDDFEVSARDAASVALHGFVREHVPSSVSVQHIVAHGSVYGEIMRYADEVEANLIVLGAHRPALRDYLLGPNAARVVRHARQSVMVVRSESLLGPQDTDMRQPR